MHHARRSDRGFTLVEILIAIVLVGILTAVVVIGVDGLTSKGSSSACTASADAASAGATTYFAANGAYPTTLAQMTTATPPALVLPSGVSVDGTGLVASGNGWTMAISPDSAGGRPTFVCGGSLPSGFVIGPNGHFYKFVSTPSTWAAASVAARTITSGPLTGYLVTITSPAENAFVLNLIGASAAWIGANDLDAENVWRWVDGPESGQQFWSGKGAPSGGAPVSGRYSSWYTAEPNSDGEDCGHIFASTGLWNDWVCGNAIGYVVELGGWTQPPCTGVATNVASAAEAYRASTGSYPTSLTQLTAGGSPYFAVPSGLTADPGGVAVSSSSYTVALWPNGTSAPNVLCSDTPPAGWAVGPSGNLYRFVSTGTTWAAAATAASALSQFGRTGHLATVTSGSEQNFIGTLQSGATAWIGGSDAATENTWIWTTGPEAGTQFWSGKGSASGGAAIGGRFTAWANSVEPNNDGEDCLQSYGSAGWNDLTCTNLLGYVVEVEP